MTSMGEIFPGLFPVINQYTHTHTQNLNQSRTSANTLNLKLKIVDECQDHINGKNPTPVCVK